MKAVMDTNELAAELSLAPGSLNKMRRQGTGPPYVRIAPKAIRYRREDVEAWLAERVRTKTTG